MSTKKHVIIASGNLYIWDFEKDKMPSTKTAQVIAAQHVEAHFQVGDAHKWVPLSELIDTYIQTHMPQHDRRKRKA